MKRPPSVERGVADRLVKYSSCLMIIVNKRNISKIFFIFDDSQKVRVRNYRQEKRLIIKLLIRITRRLKILFDSTGLPLDQHVWNSFGVGPCGNDGGRRQLGSGKKILFNLIF